MTRWLLAAEADKIQDFIFRSSRLVQVAGGSGLLARFCQEVPPLLIEHHTGKRPRLGDEDIAISAGGSFRLTFTNPNDAVGVGKDLAEIYYRITDGSLTVTEPQAYERDNFAAASQAAEVDLRMKKADQRNRCTATAQLPYTAICASCGVALASQYHSRHADERPKYICSACVHKAAERDMARQAPERELFLRTFYHYLAKTTLVDELPSRFNTDLFPADADAVGIYDARSYVAYLLADGNGMGVLFSRCKKVETMQKLSAVLTDALWAALASATAQASAQLLTADLRIPVMPLILGGDDLFALIPAPYALDFARQLCLEYEKRFRPIVRSLGLVEKEEDLPTLATAVVICKADYPYALAHSQGENLLKRAKGMARSARLQDRINHSTIDFSLVRGAGISIDENCASSGRVFVPSASPYWVNSIPLTTVANQYGIDLSLVLKARYLMRSIPAKRRAELRELFETELPEVHDRDDALAELIDVWKPRLEALLNRIERHPAHRNILETTLGDLGDIRDTYTPWRRYPKREKNPYAHGLADLLIHWDFTQDLRYSLEAYKEE